MRVFIILSLFFITSFGLETSSPKINHPPVLKYVIDNERIFTPRQAKKLEQILAKHEKETSNEIVILTTPDHGDLPNLREYALHYFNSNGIGKAKKNNGILFAVEKEKRRIEVINGYGIEDILSDEETQTIIDSNIVPHFKKGHYYKGLKEGVKEIISAIKP